MRYALREPTTSLVTGAAGFIGHFLARALLERGDRVVGVDNLNDYYDVGLKRHRLALLEDCPGFHFFEMDIRSSDLRGLFERESPSIVINLAAQAGVRHSIEHPEDYIQSNIVGFSNVLEACRRIPLKHLLYASSSSVYGANEKVPFAESDHVDNPISLYAATKKSNELMAHAYAHLYGLPATGLRLFTVYGPMGRPDMAYFKFADSYRIGSAIRVHRDNGRPEMARDFTYVADAVDAVIRLIDSPPGDGEAHQVFNVGHGNPVALERFIDTLETAMGRSLNSKITLSREASPIPAGDVPITFASTQALSRAIGYVPLTPLETGLQDFADWYVDYYGMR